MSNFIEGPWRVSDRWWITDDAGQSFAWMKPTHPATQVELAATAHLIASAPDLYECCEKLYATYCAISPEAPIRKQLEAALKKARGDDMNADNTITATCPVCGNVIEIVMDWTHDETDTGVRAGWIGGISTDNAECAAHMTWQQRDDLIEAAILITELRERTEMERVNAEEFDAMAAHEEWLKTHQEPEPDFSGFDSDNPPY